jgi:uncharacterized YccA/Bax inhibitor family protein
MFDTGNPVFNEKLFHTNHGTAYGKMTIDGTINKTLILFLILLIPAALIWQNIGLIVTQGYLMPVMFGSIILGLIAALVTIFKKEWAMVTAPLYAAFEGVFLGTLSVLMEQMFPGIVIQAVALTFGTLGVMLMFYKTGVIKVTEKLRMGILIATGAIGVVYLISFAMSFFGTTMPYIHESGIIGIGFSLFVVGIAALNLVLDFDFIEKASKSHMPKFMEWIGAFGLMVTLIWLYIEILRLLTKLRSND